MIFRTACAWDEQMWNAMEGVYRQAFSHGRKNRNVVRKLLDREMACIHVGLEGSQVIAMALTAKLEEIQALLIDYIGIHPDWRNQGIGSQFVEYLKGWAFQQAYDGIVIEVESETGPALDDLNAKRIRFWERCGFQITDYIHDYKIVPELYRAMYLNLEPAAELPKSGEILFHYFAQYHRIAWGKP